MQRGGMMSQMVDDISFSSWDKLRSKSSRSSTRRGCRRTTGWDLRGERRRRSRTMRRRRSRGRRLYLEIVSAIKERLPLWRGLMMQSSKGSQQLRERYNSKESKILSTTAHTSWNQLLQLQENEMFAVAGVASATKTRPGSAEVLLATHTQWIIDLGMISWFKFPTSAASLCWGTLRSTNRRRRKTFTLHNKYLSTFHLLTYVACITCKTDHHHKSTDTKLNARQTANALTINVVLHLLNSIEKRF